MFFRVLGGLDVEGDDGTPLDLGGRKQRAVLAALVLAQGQAVSPGALADRVWGDDLPDRHEASLQAYVSNLRRVLEPDRPPRAPATVLVSRPAGYAMALGVDDLDLTRVAALVREARQRADGGDLTGAASALDDAAALWRGPLLPEFAGVDWVDEAAVLAAEMWRAARLDRLDIGLALGESSSLVTDAEALVAEHRYDERAHATLALVRYRAGRQRDALAGLDEARRILVEDIGVEPGPQLRRLQQDILEHAPRLDAPSVTRRSDADQAVTSSVAERAAAVTVPPAGDDLAEPVMPAPDEDRTRGAAGFHGRTGELDRMLRRGRVGAPGDVIVVSGEAGAGKTRLVEEYLRITLPDVVAWGRCPEHATQSAYWVWSQVLRQLEGLGVLGETTVDELLGTGGDSGGATADRRAVLHGAVCDALAASPQPLTLVFDDLHWADPGSLWLLVDVVGQLRRIPARIVVTTRPYDEQAGPELVDALGELARHTSSLRIELTGLDREAISAWLERSTGSPADSATVAAVADRTAGNAFFVGEMVDLLASGAPAATVPSAVHEAVRRRVRRLPGECEQLLVVAAVVGREFQSAVLADMEQLTVLDVIDRLQPAIDHGLLEVGDQPGVGRFAHAIVADALAAEMSVAQRARTHARAAEVLVARRAGANPNRLPEVAYHAYQGMAAGTAALAFEWSRRAAEDAAERLGDEDAVVHWGRALEALELLDPTDRSTRLDLLIERGRALMRLDDIGQGAPCLVEAMGLAIELGDVERIERCVHAMEVASSWQSGEVGADVDVVAGIQAALHTLPTDRGAARALAMAQMADFGYWTRPAAECAAAADAAVEIARTVDDPELLTRVLNKRALALWRPSTFAGRIAAVEELLQSVAASSPASLRSIALLQRSAVAWELGDTAMAQRLLDRVTHEGARSVVVDLQAQWSHAALLLWRGQLHAAERELRQGITLFRRTRRWGADEYGGAFLAMILVEQDRLAEAAELAEVLTGGIRSEMLVEFAVHVLAEAGRVDEASALLRAPFDSDSWQSPAANAMAMHNRVRFGDRVGAAAVMPMLRPASGRLATAGSILPVGDVDFAIARGLHLLGDHHEAAEMLERSIATLRRSESGPWLVRALLWRWELTGQAGDLTEARALAATRRLPLLQRQLDALP